LLCWLGIGENAPLAEAAKCRRSRPAVAAARLRVEAVADDPIQFSALIRQVWEESSSPSGADASDPV